MSRLMFSLRAVTGAFLTAVLISTGFAADATKDEAVKKDRKRIEGTWKVVRVVWNGKEIQEEVAGSLTVVNSADGTWSLRQEGREIGGGTSTLDPTGTPKTIDFTVTRVKQGAGKDKKYHGVYELGREARKLCFAPAEKDRPAKFASEPGSGHILVTFKRVK